MSGGSAETLAAGDGIGPEGESGSGRTSPLMLASTLWRERDGRYAASFTFSPTRRTSRSSISTRITTHEGSNSKRPMLNLGLDG